MALALALLAPLGPAAAAEDPTAPTGRAVCNTAFTAAAVLGFGNFVVPADAPLGPNQVITALTPILQLCVDTYPPRPPTRCATTDALVPSTPLPIALPDAGGILAEQTQAVVAALGDPVATALGGPLRNLFVTGLGCDLLARDESGLPPVPPPATASAVQDVAGAPMAAPSTANNANTAPAGATPTEPPRTDAPPLGLVPVVRSLLPGPLRGSGAIIASAGLVALALVLARQLAPRPPTSLARARARRR